MVGTDKLGSIILFGLAVFAILLITARFLRLLRRRHTDDRILAHYVEDHIPDFEQRLLTSLEFSEDDLKFGRAGVSQQFIQQLWEDAQTHVAEQQRRLQTSTRAAILDDTCHRRRGRLCHFGNVLEFGIIAEVRRPSGLAFRDLRATGCREFLPEIEISVEPGDLELQRGSSVTSLLACPTQRQTASI